MSYNLSRVCALVDMDCFYVQVEERLDPSVKGHPAAVVQYNAWKGGGLIAVNYEARARGVGRHMRGDDAKKACPEIILLKVPELRGKADLTRYRSAGAEVIKVLSSFSPLVERASVDEAYVDLTPLIDSKLQNISFSSNQVSSLLTNLNENVLINNYVVNEEEGEGEGDKGDFSEWVRGLDEMRLNDVKLALGAEIVGQMRKAIFDKTGFTSSAGIAHNKVLAKLACGLNKPNKQTVLPHSSVLRLYENIPVKKVRNLGGKLGDEITQNFNIKTMAELSRISEKDLITAFGTKTGEWLHKLSHGFDDEGITARSLPKSIGCNKMFNGPEALKSKDKVKHWIQQLCIEVVERLKKDLDLNNRRARSLTLHVSYEDGDSVSRSCGTNPSYDPTKMYSDVLIHLEKLYTQNKNLSITNLGVIASKFEEDGNVNNSKIDSFFTKASTSSSISKPPPQNSNHLTNNYENSITNHENLANNYENNENFEKNEDELTASDSSVSLLQNNTEVNPYEILTQEEKIIEEDNNSNLDLINTEDSNLEQINIENSNSLKIDAENSNSLKIDAENSNSLKIDAENSNSLNFNDEKPSTSTNSKNNSNPLDHNSQNLNNYEPNGPLVSKFPGKLSKNSPLKSVSQKCGKCGQDVLIWDFASHSDYHFARDLQREINGLPPLPPKNSKIDKKTNLKDKFEPVSLPKNIKSKNGTGKRGRPPKNKILEKETGPKMRKLDSYFTPISPPNDN